MLYISSIYYCFLTDTILIKAAQVLSMNKEYPNDLIKVVEDKACLVKVAMIETTAENVEQVHNTINGDLRTT